MTVDRLRRILANLPADMLVHVVRDERDEAVTLAYTTGNALLLCDYTMNPEDAHPVDKILYDRAAE